MTTAPDRRTRRVNANEQMMPADRYRAQVAVRQRHLRPHRPVSLNADVLYNERITDQQIAGYPYQSRPSAPRCRLTAPSTRHVNGVDAESFRRRLWEVPRTTDSQLKTLRFAPTVSGYFEVRPTRPSTGTSAHCGTATSRSRPAWRHEPDRSSQALGASFIDAAGVAQCGTAEAIRWATAVRGTRCCRTASQARARWPTRICRTSCSRTSPTPGTTKTTSFTANLAGSLVRPCRPATWAFAVGVEHRKEEGSYVAGRLRAVGRSPPAWRQHRPRASYELNEVYLELNVPILADMPFAKELTLNAASRYSDYSNFGDTTQQQVRPDLASDRRAAGPRHLRRRLPRTDHRRSVRWPELELRALHRSVRRRRVRAASTAMPPALPAVCRPTTCSWARATSRARHAVPVG